MLSENESGSPSQNQSKDELIKYQKKSKKSKKKMEHKKDKEIDEDLKIPPRIIHVFTKMDEAQNNQKIMEQNQEILRVLTRDRVVDQRLFISCKPERKKKKPTLTRQNSKSFNY